jgi:hypothetical protein
MSCLEAMFFFQVKFRYPTSVNSVNTPSGSSEIIEYYITRSLALLNAIPFFFQVKFRYPTSVNSVNTPSGSSEIIEYYITRSLALLNVIPLAFYSRDRAGRYPPRRAPTISTFVAFPVTLRMILTSNIMIATAAQM